MTVILSGDNKYYQLRIRSSRNDRHVYTKKFFAKDGWQEIRIPLDSMEPYFRGQRLRMSNFDKKYISEIGFLDQSIFPSIVKFLTNYANQISVNQLRFSMPQDHPFSVFCRRFGTQTTISHRGCGGGMMRLIRQTTTLKKMCYELTSRLQKSASYDTN